MLEILGLFLQAAASHILYLTLRLESGSFPRPLRGEEEGAAFAAARQGDREARDRLIRHNLRLVAHVAKKYYAATAAQDDLVSIGTIGLIKAVDSFDPARRVRFASYASQCIENAILTKAPSASRGSLLPLQAGVMVRKKGQCPLPGKGDAGIKADRPGSLPMALAWLVQYKTGAFRKGSPGFVFTVPPRTARW